MNNAELVKALRCVTDSKTCTGCQKSKFGEQGAAYRCDVIDAAADTIERLTRALADKTAERDAEKRRADVAKAEKDAAVEDINRIFACGANCIICAKYKTCDYKNCSIGFCASFKWRGVQREEQA